VTKNKTIHKEETKTNKRQCPVSPVTKRMKFANEGIVSTSAIIA